MNKWNMHKHSQYMHKYIHIVPSTCLFASLFPFRSQRRTNAMDKKKKKKFLDYSSATKSFQFFIRWTLFWNFAFVSVSCIDLTVKLINNTFREQSFSTTCSFHDVSRSTCVCVFFPYYYYIRICGMCVCMFHFHIEISSLTFQAVQ